MEINEKDMNEQEKELLIKDLCERLPYGVICYAPDNEYGETGVLYSLDPFEKYDPNTYIQYPRGNVLTLFISDIKPYLRPLSSMTDNEKEELKLAFHCDYADDECMEYTVGGSVDTDVFSVYYADCVKLKSWLDSKMLDYRGLIPKGLALEAKEGMYN